jgi:hypothetical protein
MPILPTPWAPASSLVSEISSENEIIEARERSALPRVGNTKTADRDYREIKQRAEVLPRLIPLLIVLRTQWRYINSGYQFRFPDGKLLCWWPRSGSTMWQGNVEPGSTPVGVSIEQMLVECVERQAAADLPQVFPVMACLVCGKAHQEITCILCGKKQDDLCPTCFPFSHWCE